MYYYTRIRQNAIWTQRGERIGSLPIKTAHVQIMPTDRLIRSRKRARIRSDLKRCGVCATNAPRRFEREDRRGGRFAVKNQVKDLHRLRSRCRRSRRCTSRLLRLTAAMKWANIAADCSLIQRLAKLLCYSWNCGRGTRMEPDLWTSLHHTVIHIL